MTSGPDTRPLSSDPEGLFPLFEGSAPRLVAWLRARADVSWDDRAARRWFAKAHRAVLGPDGRPPGSEGLLAARLRFALAASIEAGAEPAASDPLRGETRARRLDDVVSPADVARYEAALRRLAPADRDALVARIELGYGYGQLTDGEPAAARRRVVAGLERLAQDLDGDTKRTDADRAALVAMADLESPASLASHDRSPAIGLLADLAAFHRRWVHLASRTADDVPSRDPFAATPSAAPPSWGPFELIAEVGRGGFGEVYRARDAALQRDVAVKLLQPRSGRLAEQERMLAEGRLMARVRHPNVVTVHGADTYGGRVGLWMEFVRGTTLRSLLDSRGPFGAAEAALVGRDVCRALAAVHRAGLLHRDVKDNNVMREDGGRVVLMDFGAGLSRDESSPDAVVGTPLYLAPELFEGGEASVQSDIYSVGVLLFHLVSGEYPVSGEDFAAVRAAHRADRRVALQDVRADLPEGFVQVVERALSTDPERRFPSAGSMTNALGHALGLEGELSESISTPPTNAGDPPHRGELRLPVSASWLPRAGVGGLALLIPLALLAVALWVAWRPRPVVDALPVRSLAVAAFAAGAGDADWAALAAGMTDDVVVELQWLGVAVKGRADGRRIASLTDSEAAERLGVDAVLRGDLARDGERARLALRLQTAGGGDPAWEAVYERPLAGLARLPRTAARELAGALGIGSAEKEPPSPSSAPASFGAYSAYHRGRVYSEQRTKESLETALQYFRQAAALEPAYGQAWAGLADAYLALGIPAFGTLRPQEARRLAKEAALRALELEGGRAEAKTSLGFAALMYDWNWEAAERHLTEAIILNPQYANARHWYAEYLNVIGRHDASMEQIAQAMEIEPLSILYHRDVGWYYFSHGRFEAAEAQLRETLRRAPGYVPARSLLGRVLVELGRVREGIEELRSVESELPRASVAAFLADAHAAAGDTARARELLAELLELDRTSYVSPYYVALVHARLGETDAALTWLERGLERQDSTMVNLKVDPRLDPLRGEPRFVALLSSMAYPES